MSNLFYVEVPIPAYLEQDNLQQSPGKWRPRFFFFNYGYDIIITIGDYQKYFENDMNYDFNLK